MSIRVSRDIPTLGSRKFLKLNNPKVGESVKRMASSNRIDRDHSGEVDLKVSEELSTGSNTLKVSIENLSAANSITQTEDIIKEIAVLTQKYVFRNASDVSDVKE